MKYFQILLTFLLISCNADIKEVALKDTSITTVSNIKQLNPGFICFKDSLMILTDWAENPRIHIYDKNSYEYYGSTGNVGSGPNEFSSPECLCTESSNEPLLFINDLGQAKIHAVSLDSILKNDKTIIAETTTFPASLFVSDNLYFNKSENIIIGEDLDPSNSRQFYKYDIGSKKIENLYEKEVEYLDLVDDQLKKNVAKTFVSYSKENNKIVMAYLLFNRIDILDMSFNLEKTIFYDGQPKDPNHKVPYDERNVHYFRKALMFKDSFIVPYKGFSSDSELAVQHTELVEFNYAGEVINKYKVNAIVESLAYDKENDTLYAIIFDESNPVVKINL